MVCTSTAEAEVHAVMDVVNTVRGVEGVLGEILSEFFQGLKGIPIIFSDNQPGLDAVRARKSRTKHYNVKVKHIAEPVDHGEFKLQKISTSANIADLFTKALRAVRFAALSRFFMTGPARASSM